MWLKVKSSEELGPGLPVRGGDRARVDLPRGVCRGRVELPGSAARITRVRDQIGAESQTGNISKQLFNHPPL